MSWWKEIEQLSTVTPIFTHHLLCSLSLGLFLSFTQDLHCKQNEARTSCRDISWCRHQTTDLGLDLQPKLLELLLQFKKGLLIPGAPKVVLECHDKMGGVLLRKSLLLLPTFSYLDLSCFDGMDYLIFIWAFCKPTVKPVAAQPKGMCLLWNQSSDSGSVQVHPGLRWMLWMQQSRTAHSQHH